MPNNKTQPQAWDPNQYARFASERSSAFFDLLSLVTPVPDGQVVDLGCGTGELTRELHKHTRAQLTTGIDSSEAMLAKALPLAGAGLCFRLGDIADFDAPRSFDVVFANASLQWVPDHPRLLGRLAATLRPGGQLAIQVPANADHASHALADQVASQEPFASYLGSVSLAGTSAVCAPERYAELVHEIGFVDQSVRLQVYGHKLACAGDVVEWTRGTTLLRAQSRLPEDLFDQFVTRYRQALAEVLGDQTPYFYTFKRILIWARAPGD